MPWSKFKPLGKGLEVESEYTSFCLYLLQTNKTEWGPSWDGRRVTFGFLVCAMSYAIPPFSFPRFLLGLDCLSGKHSPKERKIRLYRQQALLWLVEERLSLMLTAAGKCADLAFKISQSRRVKFLERWHWAVWTWCEVAETFLTHKWKQKSSLSCKNWSSFISGSTDDHLWEA